MAMTLLMRCEPFALTELHTGDIDIFQIGPTEGSCIINRHRYKTVGIGDFTDCDFTNTDDIDNYLLAGGAQPRVILPSERGEIAYLGVCTGCPCLCWQADWSVSGRDSGAVRQPARSAGAVH